MVQKLSHDLWIKSFELVPRIAFNLVVTDNRGKVLLTKRAIPPYTNMWHIPGSFLRKGETIVDCLKRVGKEELNINIIPGKLKFLDLFENLDKDPRGHIIDIFYGYTVKQTLLKPHGDTKEIRFFNILPEAIGFNHQETLRRMGFK